MFAAPFAMVEKHTPYIAVHILMSLHLKPNTLMRAHEYAYMETQEGKEKKARVRKLTVLFQ